MILEDMVSGTERARFAAFLSELHEQGRAERTLAAYKSDWEQFAPWYANTNGEPFDLTRLAALDVQDYLNCGQSQGRKPSSLNRRLTFLKAYTAWGEE